MKLLTKDTGISVALALTLIGGAVYMTMAQQSTEVMAREAVTKVEEVRAEISEIKGTLTTEFITKSEVTLGTEVITEKLNAVSERQISDIKRIEIKLDRIENKIDLIRK